MNRLLSVILGMMMAAPAWAGGLCDDPTRSSEVCNKMHHLRSQIYALDAQRELMQVNQDYMKNIGKTLSLTAKDILRHIGPGLPEHHQALSGVATSGEELSRLAAKSDPQMLVQANMIRVNCAVCHDARVTGRPSWDDVFGNDWRKIAEGCRLEGKNPYLCKSMNGMLSAFGYLFTGTKTDIQDMEMTAQAATEIIRILDDLKRKNFTHLPEPLREEALQAALQTQRMARARNPGAFEQGMRIMDACVKCHDQRFGPADPSQPRVLEPVTTVSSRSSLAFVNQEP